MSAVPDPAPFVPHGGGLHEAAARHDIPYADWLDLSTGINPHGYPVPPVPPEAWRRLPDDGDDFAAHAARYYGAPDAAHVLPVAGSQAAIRALPALLPPARVGIASPTYGEYAPAFARAGHEVVRLDVSSDALPAALVHVAVVNPNNPDAERLDAARLLRWRAQLAGRGGTLIVDEAFADAQPEHSLAPCSHLPGLFVLRSPGKFFGLAGVRAGFVLAEPRRLEPLRRTLGPWTVSGPARHAVRAAFADTAWQQAMRARLVDESARLAALLGGYGLSVRSTPLFCWFAHPQAAALHEALAQRAIWTRLFAAPDSLRLGLPQTGAHWMRLAGALAEILPSLHRSR